MSFWPLVSKWHAKWHVIFRGCYASQLLWNNMSFLLIISKMTFFFLSSLLSETSPWPDLDSCDPTCQKMPHLVLFLDDLDVVFLHNQFLRVLWRWFSPKTTNFFKKIQALLRQFFKFQKFDKNYQIKS